MSIDPIILQAWKSKTLRTTVYLGSYPPIVSGHVPAIKGGVVQNGALVKTKDFYAKSVKFTVGGAAIVSANKPIKFVGLEAAHRIANLSLTDRVRSFLQHNMGYWTIHFIARELDEPVDSVAAQLRRFRRQGVAESRKVGGKIAYSAVRQ